MFSRVAANHVVEASSFSYTSNSRSSLSSSKPLCGQVIKLDCGQFRPAVANALLHVKHLCPVDIGELLHAALSTPRTSSFSLKDNNIVVNHLHICKQFR